MNKKRMKKTVRIFLKIVFIFLGWFTALLAIFREDWIGYAYAIGLITIMYSNIHQWEDDYSEKTELYWQDVALVLLILAYLIYERKVAFGVLKDFLGF